MTDTLKHRNHQLAGVTDIENIQGFTQVKNSNRNDMDIFYGVQLALNDTQPLILYPNESLLMDNTYVVLDIENHWTESRRRQNHSNRSGKLKNNKVIDSFERLINPEIEIPEFIYDLTHLDPKEIENEF
uniref:hypothetical protein n=1 Tax=Lactococcus sp. TaxID=44273 RepID=UPI003241C572